MAPVASVAAMALVAPAAPVECSRMLHFVHQQRSASLLAKLFVGRVFDNIIQTTCVYIDLRPQYQSKQLDIVSAVIFGAELS